ncbi:MAG TPA: hypothetical protein VFV08_08540 [Puia sp.]|nr:hypothetical protein [Puia sp.]
MEKNLTGENEWNALDAEDLSLAGGGEGLIYYLSYDLGFLVGTTLKVASQIGQSLLLDRALRPIK